MFDGFAGSDFEDAVTVSGFEVVAIEVVGEAEVTAPGSAAESTQQRCRVVVLLGLRPFGADGQVAIGGFDVDRVAVDAG